MKNIFNKLSVDSFTLDSGVKVFMVNSKTFTSNVVSLYVNSGNVIKSSKIDSVTVNKAFPYVLSEALKNSKFGDLDNLTYLLNTTFNTKITPSYSLYSIYTKNSLDEAIRYLSFYSSSYDCSSDKLENIKNKLIVNLASQDKMLNELYSQLDVSARFTKEDVLSINQTSMHKYYSRSFSSSNICLFAVGCYDKDQIKNLIKAYHFGSLRKEEETVDSYQESYEKVNKTIIDRNIKASYYHINFGVKLPSREMMFKDYGNELFALNNYAKNLMFGELSPLYKKLNEKVFVSQYVSNIVEANEETYMNVMFYVDDYETAIKLINDRLSHNCSLKDYMLFRSVKRKLASSYFMERYDVSKYLSTLVECYANNIDIDEFYKSVVLLKFGSYRKYSKMIKNCSSVITIDKELNI